MMNKAISSLPRKRSIAPDLKALQWDCGHCGYGNWNETHCCKHCGAQLPHIQLFTTNDSQIKLGKPIRMRWEVNNAEKVQVLPDEEIATPSGEMDVFPMETTEYRLIAENKTGRIEQSLVLELSPPCILEFAATETVIQVDYPVILHWVVENGAELSIDRGVGTVTGRSFAEVLLQEPGVYTLSARNASGEAQAQIELSLPLPEIGLFYAGSEVVRLGQASWLHWEVDNASKLQLLPDPGDVTGSTSTELYPDRTTEYTLIASNFSGSVEAKIQLELPPPLIRKFTTSSPISTEGEPITLSWEVENAYHIEILPDIGEVGAIGQTKIRPQKAYTEFTLTAMGHSGQAYKQQMITLFPLPLEENHLLSGTELFMHMEQQEEHTKSVHPDAQLRQMEEHLSQANDFLIKKLEIIRVREMELTNEMLAMKKPSVRKEIQALFKKIKSKLNKR